MEEAEKKACLNKALARLGRGDLTARQMMAHLTEKRPGREPFSQEAAKETVRFLLQQGLLDDKRYLRLLLAKMDASLYGPRKIREELKKRKFSPALVERAFSRELDQAARAKTLLEKERKTGLSQTPEGRKKLCAFLVRKGYDYAAANAAIAALLRENPDWEEKEF